MPSNSTTMLSIKCRQFTTSLASTVETLRSAGDLFDVTLAAGGRRFPAHRIVLSAASSFLKELLKSTPCCQHPVIVLADVSASDLESLLEFIYRGQVCVDQRRLASLLQAAQCMQIGGFDQQTSSSDDVATQRDVIPHTDATEKLAHRCPHCAYTSPRLCNVRRHMHTHTGEEPFECAVCHLLFSRSQGLKRHRQQSSLCMLSAATTPPKVERQLRTFGQRFECDVCHSSYSHLSSLQKHIRRLHSGNPIVYECDLCSKKFSEKSNLKRHMKIHVGRPAFVCYKCPSMFSRICHLTEHMRLKHTTKSDHYRNDVLGANDLNVGEVNDGGDNQVTVKDEYGDEEISSLDILNRIGGKRRQAGDCGSGY